MSRIAYVYPKALFSAWSLAEGAVRTLKRMGHEVLDIPAPPAPESDQVPTALVERLRKRMPALDELKGCDAIIVSGPEHIACWLDAVWGIDQWKFELTMPKAALYHETAQRADGGIFEFDRAFWVADNHFFPAVQDAEFYDQEQFVQGRSHWLPFGADTDVFKPLENYENFMTNSEWRNGKLIDVSKKYDLAFIGSVYGYRAKYLGALGQFEHPDLRIGNVQVQDIAGMKGLETANLYAENLRQIKVFFNLPTLSRLLVTKVYEVMACGTFLMTPSLETAGGAAKNTQIFKSGEHLVYYSPRNIAQTAQLLKTWTSDEMAAERERIAASGCAEVHAKYRLDQALQQVLDKSGVRETVNA